MFIVGERGDRYCVFSIDVLVTTSRECVHGSTYFTGVYLDLFSRVCKRQEKGRRRSHLCADVADVTHEMVINADQDICFWIVRVRVRSKLVSERFHVGIAHVCMTTLRSQKPPYFSV
jgi:hypothetical protein